MTTNEAANAAAGAVLWKAARPRDLLEAAEHALTQGREDLAALLVDEAIARTVDVTTHTTEGAPDGQ